MRSPTNAALLLLALAGCGAATTDVVEPELDPLAPTTLYPMGEGAQWVYDVDTGGDEPPTLGIFEVVYVNGNDRRIANVRGMNARGIVTHGDAIGYRIERGGIRHLATGTWVLREPIAVGASWEGMGGRTARDTDIARRVEVVAGTYEGCVVVEESGGEDGRVVSTTYCPRVGPVIIESTLRSELTNRTIGTQARLRSHDPG